MEGVSRRIRWVGVVVGVAVTVLVGFPLTLFVFSVIDAHLYRVYVAEGTRVTAREDALFNTLSGGYHLIAALLASSLAGSWSAG